MRVAQQTASRIEKKKKQSGDTKKTFNDQFEKKVNLSTNMSIPQPPDGRF